MKKFVILFIVVIILSGCSRLSVNNTVLLSKNEIELDHALKTAFNQDSACWYSTINLNYSKVDINKVATVDNTNKENINNIIYDGVNICEKPIDETYAYRKYSVGHEYSKDIELINKFLNENKYNRKINIDDLNGLKLDFIAKYQIVKVYNLALNQQIKEFGNFYQKELIKFNSYEKHDVKIEISTLINRGYIEAINLQFATTNGTSFNLSTGELEAINISVNNELVLTQKNQVESIPYSDNLINLSIINDALNEVLVKYDQ